MTDYIFKICVFGDYNTGKTSFVNYLRNYNYVENYEPTIGVEYSSKIVELSDNKLVKVAFWDCAGQERFHSVTNNFFKDVTGGLLFFDVTNKESYQNVIYWVEKFRNNNDKNIPIILVGNKIDEDLRQISKNDAYILASDYNLTYIEISVKKGININNTLNLLIDKIYFQKYENPNIIINEEKNKLILRKNEYRYSCGDCCLC